MSGPDYAAWSRPAAENPRIDAALLEKERDLLSCEAFFQERCEHRGSAPRESAGGAHDRRGLKAVDCGALAG